MGTRLRRIVADVVQAAGEFNLVDVDGMRADDLRLHCSLAWTLTDLRSILDEVAVERHESRLGRGKVSSLMAHVLFFMLIFVRGVLPGVCLSPATLRVAAPPPSSKLLRCTSESVALAFFTHLTTLPVQRPVPALS